MNVDLSGVDAIRSGVRCPNNCANGYVEAGSEGPARCDVCNGLRYTQTVKVTPIEMRRAEVNAKISFDNITSVWKSVFTELIRQGANFTVAASKSDAAVTAFLKQGWNPLSGPPCPEPTPEQPTVPLDDPYVEAMKATLAEANALIGSMEGSLPIELREAVIAYRNKAKERSTELRRLQEQHDLARLTIVQERDQIEEYKKTT